MVHVFTYKDKNYIYDSGSGSLHECDKETADYVKAKYEKREDTNVPQDVADRIEKDLASLKDRGLFLRKEISAYPMKPGEIKALCIHICHDCNLRCRYCFADEGAYHSEREFMSEKTAKKAVDFLLENSGNRKVLEVDFFGGEPLMCLQTIKNVVAYARGRGKKLGKKFLFTTTTNALLLDDDALKYIKIFTDLPKDEIDALAAAQAADPSQRPLQKRLAEEITVMVHSRADYEAAVEASQILFSNKAGEILHKIDEDTLLAVFDGVPQFEIPAAALDGSVRIAELLTDIAPVFPSKGELRKLAQGNGLSINKEKVTDINAVADASMLLQNRYILVQKGKKNYFLLRVQ